MYEEVTPSQPPRGTALCASRASRGEELIARGAPLSDGVRRALGVLSLRSLQVGKAGNPSSDLKS